LELHFRLLLHLCLTRTLDAITLSTHFTEISKLPETVFYPPRDLEVLRIHDHSEGTHHWPLESDIARCTDLKVLDLGISALEQPNTIAAVGFLIFSYQATLTDLTLGRLWSRFRHGPPGVDGVHSFSPIFQGYADRPPYDKLSFPNLITLRLISTETVTVFAAFDAPQLMAVEVGAFSGDGPTTAPEGDEGWEAWWQSKLSVPTLGRLKTLKMRRGGEHEQFISRACHTLGIEFSVDGHLPMDEDF